MSFSSFPNSPSFSQGIKIQIIAELTLAMEKWVSMRGRQAVTDPW